MRWTKDAACCRSSGSSVESTAGGGGVTEECGIGKQSILAPENEAVCRQKCKNGNEKMYAHGTKSNNTGTGAVNGGRESRLYRNIRVPR